MSKSREVQPLEPKRCAHCGGVLSDRRPPYLLMSSSGNVVGEFHAGCAEKLVVESETMKPAVRGVMPGHSVGRLLPREETLPW